jgi:hypothetical protein
MKSLVLYSPYVTPFVLAVVLVCAGEWWKISLGEFGLWIALLIGSLLALCLHKAIWAKVVGAFAIMLLGYYPVLFFALFVAYYVTGDSI